MKEASELYGICRELAEGVPSAEATRRLHEVLVLACAEGCRKQGGAFGNLFSQVDFVCKRLGMSVSQTIAVQTARRHTNTGAPISADDWQYDIMAVARLVSAVFNSDIPGELRSLLPTNARPYTKAPRVNKDYVRCIVDSFDADTITADTEEGIIRIDYGNTDGGRDFAYLRKVLRQGMQLNLLDCSMLQTTTPNEEWGGVCIPGTIVVEPDFLIDISSLAACFTAYGHHPLLYTVNRLKEKPNSQATLLGNFAGTALDDIINRGSEATLAASLQRSFREQALRLLTCPDFNAEKFKLQAAEQMKNIREAVELLKEPLTKGMPLLEPSFVCERLGLQGRVDLMTVGTPAPQSHGQSAADSGAMLLVEQKSGKNMKIEMQSHDPHGLQLENHYVQLLLYYGVLRYNFGKSDRQVDTRLLYSRYPAAKGLLTVNYYRTLLREAIRLRNQIVATELLMAREGVHRILPMLNADVLYKGIARDAYFHRYVLPEILSINSRLSALSPVERAYYERMLTFVYREQVAGKLGSAEARLHHSGGCAADLWQMPFSEKVETGNIILCNRISSLEFRVLSLEFATAQPSANSSAVANSTPYTLHSPLENRAVANSTLYTLHSTLLNFRPGDMVYLYSFAADTTPDVRNAILYKGTLQELNADSLTIALNDEQHNADIFKPREGQLWAVEHGGSDVGTSSSIRALQRFATANPHRRALLLGQRAPVADTSLRISRSYHPDYDEVLLGIKQARDYFLLVGPPGTGKTSMALRFVVEEELQNPAYGILLTAYTNRAVDEICSMLCDARLPFLRLGRASSCDERFRDRLLDTALAATHHFDDARRLVDDTPIIVATTATLQAQPYILELKHFSLAVVDEASQILEPSVIGLLSSDAVDRFVLIGDHKQLPAVVQQEPEQSVVGEQCLRDIGLEDCRQSLFERLLRWERRQGRTKFIGTLHTHGRMHPDIALFPLQHFYQREALRPVPLPHQQEASLGYTLPARDHLDELLKTKRVVFIQTPVGNPSSEELEARLVADILLRIHRFTGSRFDPAKTVGVIVPYRRQIALIRQALASAEPSFPAAAITIDTVERYQGSQRDVIVYSFAVSRRFQLDFLTAATFTDDDGQQIDRKLNVALTRARRQMIIVGRPDIIATVPLFAQLMGSCT